MQVCKVCVTRRARWPGRPAPMLCLRCFRRLVFAAAAFVDAIIIAAIAVGVAVNVPAVTVVGGLGLLAVTARLWWMLRHTGGPNSA